MTLNQVKRDLPQIRVKHNGKGFWGKLSGRKNSFATVTIFGEYSHALQANYIDFYASWETVTRVINNPELYLTV